MTAVIQTELHRHLDVSARPRTIYRLAQERGLVSASTSFERFRETLVLTSPLEDLNAVLHTFALFQKILDRPESLEQVAFEVVEDLWNEGTRKAELRFSPSFVTEFSNLSWDDLLSSFERGIARALVLYPDMKIGLLCIASRDYGPLEVGRTLEFFLKNRARFVGIDLAGNESEFPCRAFEDVFRPARTAGASITIHAGEASGPENIWQAIDLLGARRIGHGISAVLDPNLMNFLAKHSICLEMCPTSNWLTRAVDSIENHPLPKVLRAGVPVCVNTDDPAVFGVTLPSELNLARTRMGLSPSEIDLSLQHAFQASFIV